MHDDFSSRTRTISRGERREFFSRSKIGSVLLEDTDRKGKFKRILSFLFVEKKSFQQGKLTSMTSTKFSTRQSACPVLKCNQDSTVCKEFSVSFLHKIQRNYAFKREFWYL